MSKAVSGDGVSVWGWGVSVRRGSLSKKVSVQGGSLYRDPAEREMRAIRILVECFLVLF